VSHGGFTHPEAARQAGCTGTWKNWGAVGLVLVVLAALVGWLVMQGLSLEALSNPHRLRTLILAWGAWGGLALVGLQILQILLAPIPGQVLGLVGGYLYGPWLGTVFNMIGTLVGSGLAMWLARHFGRPLVERLVSHHWLDRLDGFARRHGAAVFFLIFLFPFLPDDAACFVAGLSPLPLGELLLIVLVGRLPGVFIPNWLGAHATELSPGQWLVIILVMVPIAAAFWHWQDRIVSQMLRCLDWIVSHAGL
jgi:uncharacterized membrane protein YdjX (TVP38/TMEM64 family)